MNQILDYYKLLQVDYGAEKAEIAAAYKRLCKLYHPDINASPEAEELMKQINLAYTALCDDKAGFAAVHARNAQRRQQERNEADIRKAQDCVKRYFSALLNGDYTAAYYLLSDYDRRYVTLQSFCEWRKSVNKLFVMREFSIKSSSHVFTHELKDGAEVPAVSHSLSIMERNTTLHSVESYRATKLSIMEPGGWRIFLGYRDLNEIAKIFEDLSIEQEKGAMAKHWEEYCSNTCRDLNMLNLSGLIKKASPEIYRYRRYKQQMTIACFRVKPVISSVSDELRADAIESAAKTITDSLRETDIPAYLGNGIFAVLFIELRKKNAELISQRITNRLRNNVHRDVRTSVYVDCKFEFFEGGQLEEYIDRCSRFAD